MIRLLTPKEVMTALNVSRSTLDRLIRRGDLIAYKVGHKLRLDAGRFAEFLEKGST